MGDILFFTSRGRPIQSVEETLNPVGRIDLQVWTPRWFNLKPRQFSFLPYSVWWLFNYVGIFRNDQYRIFLFKEQGKVVHRSCLFPPFFRFPFMAAADVQVGDIWTVETKRGQGLSKAMLKHIMSLYPNTRIWFLCESANQASANLARSAGMQLHGVGRREARFGIGLFGRFVVRSSVDV